MLNIASDTANCFAAVSAVFFDVQLSRRLPWIRKKPVINFNAFEQMDPNSVDSM